METYITKEGDTAEAIAWKYYGTQGGRVTEQLLDMNPGLADFGPALPGGLALALPAIDTTAKVQGVKLWD
jgi:phage tail protein X